MEERISENKERRNVRVVGLGKEITREIFVELATTLVSIAVGFSIIFATELGVVGIFVFIIVAISVLSWWWSYLSTRMRYIRPDMPFPIVDALLLIVISCFPCAIYGIGNFRWPFYSVVLVLALLFAVWSLWWHHLIKEFPEEIRKHGKERLFRHYRKIFIETAAIYGSGVFISFAGVLRDILSSTNVGGIPIIELGFIIFGSLWVNIRERKVPK